MADLPGHGIVGEELGDINPSADYRWTIDPIDGTHSFRHHIPLYGTILGLVHHDLPVLGVIENMSGFTCPTCGEHIKIFGTDGGRTMAQEMNVPYLGPIPIDTDVVASGDSGKPVVQAHPHSDTSRAFGRIVRHLLRTEREDINTDRERYQTVYARQQGAVAAPTAGLHFDEAMLEKIKGQGVEIVFVTLHVGAGTFQPVRVDDIAEHQMHSEWMQLNDEVVQTINKTRARGGRVIAVGTTSVRCLETAAQDGELTAYSGETDIFITPGYRFRVVDALLTNFHLPESTLLMLVSAFAGHDNIMRAYRHAVAERYRFFSYGDAMFIDTKGRVTRDE